MSIHSGASCWAESEFPARQEGERARRRKGRVQLAPALFSAAQKVQVHFALSCRPLHLLAGLACRRLLFLASASQSTRPPAPQPIAHHHVLVFLALRPARRRRGHKRGHLERRPPDPQAQTSAQQVRAPLPSLSQSPLFLPPTPLSHSSLSAYESTSSPLTQDKRAASRLCALSLGSTPIASLRARGQSPSRPLAKPPLFFSLPPSSQNNPLFSPASRAVPTKEVLAQVRMDGDA